MSPSPTGQRRLVNVEELGKILLVPQAVRGEYLAEMTQIYHPGMKPRLKSISRELISLIVLSLASQPSQSSDWDLRKWEM